MIKKSLAEFGDFVRSQGVVGLAVGIILGGSVTKLVTAFVNDLINPLIGVVTGSAQSLSEATFTIQGITLKWGDFLNNLIDFLIVAAVVFFLFKLLRLELLDRKKS